MRGKRPTWYMNSACSKMVLKMVENFLSLFDFQGGSLFLEKDEKNEFFFEESDMISNIFDDANLGNTAYEPGSQLTIIDAPAT